MLVAGSHNQCAAAIGAGVIEPHLACYSIGAAEVIGTCLPAARTSPAMLEGNFPCYCHAVGSQYFTITLNQSGGLSLEWFYDSVLQGQTGEDQPPELADSTCVRPSPVLFLPHLVGSGTPSCDHSSRGAFVGLSVKTRQADLLQALIDAQAFEARLNLETLDLAGVTIADLRAVDRGARMRKALQVKATVLARPIHTLHSPEAALMGAAMLAQTAIGTFSNLEEATRECVRVASTIEPVASARAAYEAAYERFRSLYDALRSFYHHWGPGPEQDREPRTPVLPAYSGR
jgi:xylulokinase